VLVYISLLVLVIANSIAEKILLKKAIIGAENIGGKRYSSFLDFLIRDKFIIIFAMIFFATFKAVGVGMDTQNYHTYYESLRDGTVNLFEYGDNSFEVGFVFLNSILAMLNLDFVFLQLAIALITAICFSIFIKNFSDDKNMSYYLFIALGVYAQSFSLYRQIIAISLVSISIIMLNKNKYLWFLLLIILAFFFHKSAILCFSFLLLKFVKLNWKSLLFFVAIALVCYFGFGPIMQLLDKLFGVDYYEGYFISNQRYRETTSLINILYNVGLSIIFLIFFIFKNKLHLSNEQKQKYNFFLEMFLMVPLIRFVGMSLNYQALVNRFTLYFFISLIILIPTFVEGTRGTKYYKFLVPAVYIVASGYMYYYYAIKFANGVVPYKFIWTK
jgi:hypothetical protein